MADDTRTLTPVLAWMVASAWVACQMGCPGPDIQQPEPDAPVAEARIEAGDSNGGTVLLPYAHHTGGEVQLVGTRSSDPAAELDSPTLTYNWQFRETPLGSAAMLTLPHEDPVTGQPDQARPVFTPDVIGTYRVFLEVTSSVSDKTSEADYVTLEALPPQDLSITLTWNTPDTDVDLHLLDHDGFYWTDTDCYFGNPAPDWGETINAHDNPSYSGDDYDGGSGGSPGSETIVIPSPPAGRYTVAASYHSDHQSGQTVTPTLNIELAGVSVAQDLQPPVALSAGEVWVAVSLELPDGVYLTLNNTTTHEEFGGPAVNR